ncbi:hypothetical protein ACFU8X_14330 [Brevibacillus porteri]
MMKNFDGESFSESVLFLILLALLIFGSTDIAGLSAQPTKA